MRPIRVLHVLGAMNRGGVETWLMHVLRRMDPKAVRMDFLVHTDRPAVYDEEILALGSRILRCPYTKAPARYATRFFLSAVQAGPFDVLHSHVHHFSGLVVTLGRIAGIPVRIAHSHNDTSSLDSRAGLIRTAYLELTRRLIAANCTHGLGVSRAAATSLFGPNWMTDDRFQVLYCGIDAASEEDASAAAVRGEFGFSANDIVFGHVGRFNAQKNHAFLLETAAEIGRIEPRAKFLLVGDGPLRPAMEVRARELGLRDRIVFAGLRSDVRRLMRAGMDLMLLPSLYEGLPLVVLEAQAAGLTSIVSEGTPEEAVIHPDLVRSLPLSDGARVWADFSLSVAREPRFDSRRALELFKCSPFEISRAVDRLRGVYLEHPTGLRSMSHAAAIPAGRNRV